MQEHLSAGGVLRSLLVNPKDSLLRRWNWKSALLSTLVRAGIFFFANLKAGLDAATSAMATEIVFRALTAGFFGALTQSFRRVEPAWKGGLAVLILLPLANHTLEFLAHWSRGTAELFLSIGVSVAFTAVSSTFHYFVMRRGALCVGHDSQTLFKDLAGMPRHVAAFVWLPFQGLGYVFRAMARALRGKCWPAPDETAP